MSSPTTFASESDVSGPDATTVGTSSSRLVTSSLTRVKSGYAFNAFSTDFEKPSLSTDNALPDGTAFSLARGKSLHPKRSSSSLRSPEAVQGSDDLSELEHTSSARFSVLCAPVVRAGRISYIFTAYPRSRSCNAHSHPASPPPMIFTSRFSLIVRSY